MTFNKNKLRKLLFLALFCFFEGHFLYAKVFLNTGYTGFNSSLNLIEGTSHNFLWGAGVENEQLGFSVSGLLGTVPDELKLRPGSARIIIKNLNYNFFSFNFSKDISQNFGFSSTAFVGSANTSQSNLYLLNGSFEVPFYGGGNINFALPSNFDLQITYARGQLASHNEHSDQLGDGSFSLFDIRSGKTISFGTRLPQTFYSGLGFSYLGGDALIKANSDSQSSIFFPFSYFYLNANASLYFANLFLNYKIEYGNFSFFAGTEFYFNCRSYINYYYKYTMKKTQLFPGSKDTDRDSLIISNWDFLCKACVYADYSIPKINTKLYLQKELPLPVISAKTQKQFNIESNTSDTNNSQNKDELVKTILLSGLSVGLKLEF